MLDIRGISFSYFDKITLNDVNFKLNKGQILAVIGESGCGKSTLLKLIYGLYDLDKGHIFWNDTEVFGPKKHLVPGMNQMKYLAQDFDLMPYVSVAENVGKYLSNTSTDKKQHRIKELLEVVEMVDYINVQTKYLSGGQLQRIALAKALALKPQILLLDEPFSHIDNFRKNSLRRRLFAFVKRNKITTLIATHDSTDVLSFADETIVLKEGEIVAHNATSAVYNFPKNKYVASLFGDVNEIESAYFDNFGAADIVLLYAHQLRITRFSKLKVQVIHTFFRGSHYLVECSYEKGSLFFQNEHNIDNGTVVFLSKKLQN